MTNLLRIDASARIDSSISRTLANKYQHHWENTNPNGKVINRDLAQNQLPHLSDELIAAFHDDASPSSATQLSDELIHELKTVDQLLISSPLYNLTLPSTLKAYFDHIVRSGHTFDVHNNDIIGLLEGISAVVITSRGGLSDSTDTDDFQTEYLKQILSFIGITDITIISAEGTSLDEPEKSRYFSMAEQQINNLFRAQETNFWNRDFSKNEQEEISLLRDKQTQAIINGDAHFYANLCTEDVTLMIPGHDMIIGRTEFYQAEEKLFNHSSFSSFKKYPTSIERQGNIAIEFGRQEVIMNNTSNNTGVFSAKQKYMHVFRLTKQGWQYASLMSNPSE